MITIFTTPLGELHQTDCLAMLSKVPSEAADLVFADPPFNLGKVYTSKINDAREADEYLEWCRAWLDELVRTLKHLAARSSSGTCQSGTFLSAPTLVNL
jgi:site-specific DNA-methyltransferase (adenine-specific)